MCNQTLCVQWFVSVEGFRQAALDAIKSVQWLPASGQKRITSMVEGRSDWCISRQRSWGVPLPVLYYTDTGAALQFISLISEYSDTVCKETLRLGMHIHLVK